VRGPAEDQQTPAAAAAIGWAASEALERLYPSDAQFIADALQRFQSDLESKFEDRRVLGDGRRWGAFVAKTLRRVRAKDGFDAQEANRVFDPNEFPTGPYQHLPDPTAVDNDGKPQQVYASHWGDVTPFAHAAKSSLPNLLKPPLEQNYLKDFLEVKKLGEKHTFFRTQGVAPVRGAERT
jgi:hypothetical protein